MIKNDYIELLKYVLIDYHRVEYVEYRPLEFKNPTWKQKLIRWVGKYLQKRNYIICSAVFFKPELRLEGKDRPPHAETMVGLKRLNNIQFCVEQIIKDNIPGDFIETGVWRGGAVIFMKALLVHAGVTDRNIWVADSFEGLPKPNADKYPADAGDKHHAMTDLVISKEMVMNNFEKYGLLDDKVKFLKGWFKDTLPTAPIQKLSLLRLDGDMYESTMDGLNNLYPKLSKGGYIIIDDWGAVESCQLAVKDYRKAHNINEEIITIDWGGVYWRKER